MTSVNPHTGENIPTVAEVTGRRVRFVSGDEGVVQSAHGDGLTYPALDVQLDDGRVWVDVDARDVQWLLPTHAEAQALLVGPTPTAEIDPAQFDEATLVCRFGDTTTPIEAVTRAGFARHALGHARANLVEIALGLIAHIVDGECEAVR